MIGKEARVTDLRDVGAAKAKLYRQRAKKLREMAGNCKGTDAQFLQSCGQDFEEMAGILERAFTREGATEPATQQKRGDAVGEPTP